MRPQAETHAMHMHACTHACNIFMLSGGLLIAQQLQRRRLHVNEWLHDSSEVVSGVEREFLL